jgi:hypothetical protein
MSAREVIARAMFRELIGPERLADAILAALDAAGLEVRPKQQDRVETLQRWVRATAKEGER